MITLAERCPRAVMPQSVQSAVRTWISRTDSADARAERAAKPIKATKRPFIFVYW